VTAAVRLSPAFEEGCGEGCVGRELTSIGDIGDIYDAISTMQQETFAQIQNEFGVTMTQAESDQLLERFHRMQEVANTDYKYRAVEDVHTVILQILHSHLGASIPQSILDRLQANMARIETNLGNYGGGFFSDAGSWVKGQLPVVLGVVGGIVGGAVAIATFGGGAPLVPLLAAGGVAVGTAVGAGGNKLIDSATTPNLTPRDVSTSSPTSTSSGGGGGGGGAFFNIPSLASVSILPKPVPLMFNRRAALAGVTLRSGPSPVLATLPVPTTAPVSTKKKLAVVAGVGALGTLAFYAWRELM